MKFSPGMPVSDEFRPVNSPMCWDEDYWSEINEDEWDDYYRERFYDSHGG